ncbi:DUF2179 domain-containing protein [Neobacillus cucumis]|uniref:DUF2179 domain-containing protein n=1 Tax=Neobacillus cucumis TaxID=1740721 RepID=UPI001963DBDC|nr:DUF2179 domain-containing protein [Neobacillus cucumis]MBM7652529.1 uncharacterized protein YebE (UPF0316 family) [Neobacillus cucumis]
MIKLEPIIFNIVMFNIFYVSCFTLRMMLVIKGQKVLASFISMLEVYIYLLGLAIVLENLNNPINIIGYCIGWGLGVYFGSRIEEYLALGYVTIQTIVSSVDIKLPIILQKQGFSVTSWSGADKSGDRTVIQILVKRRYEPKAIKIINKMSPNAFIISYELKNFKEGFWGKAPL